jgi:hypothetical protein
MDSYVWELKNKIAEQSRMIIKYEKQLLWMRKGYDDINELFPKDEQPLLLKMIVSNHRKWKDQKKYVGCAVYDEGHLVKAGLDAKDPRLERVNESKVNFLKIIELIDGDDKDKLEKITKICMHGIRPNEF